MGGAPTPNGTIGFDPQPYVHFSRGLSKWKKMWVCGHGGSLFNHNETNWLEQTMKLKPCTRHLMPCPYSRYFFGRADRFFSAKCPPFFFTEGRHHTLSLTPGVDSDAAWKCTWLPLLYVTIGPLKRSKPPPPPPRQIRNLRGSFSVFATKALVNTQPFLEKREYCVWVCSQNFEVLMT